MGFHANRFECERSETKEAKFAQGLFGYTTYDAVQFFDTVKLKNRKYTVPHIPLMRYRLYQYVIAIQSFQR